MKLLNTTGLSALLAVTSCTGLASADAARTFRHHADEGNSALDGGRHAESLLRIEPQGHVRVETHYWNNVALAGYCFTSAFALRDAEGNTLSEQRTPQYCVDGSKVFWGRSSRVDVVEWSIPLELVSRVHSVAISHAPGGGKDPLELLHSNAERAKAILF